MKKYLFLIAFAVLLSCSDDQVKKPTVIQNGTTIIDFTPVALEPSEQIKLKKNKNAGPGCSVDRSWGFDNPWNLAGQGPCTAVTPSYPYPCNNVPCGTSGGDYKLYNFTVYPAAGNFPTFRTEPVTITIRYTNLGQNYCWLYATQIGQPFASLAPGQSYNRTITHDSNCGVPNEGVKFPMRAVFGCDNINGDNYGLSIQLMFVTGGSNGHTIRANANAVTFSGHMNPGSCAANPWPCY